MLWHEAREDAPHAKPLPDLREVLRRARADSAYGHSENGVDEVDDLAVVECHLYGDRVERNGECCQSQGRDARSPQRHRQDHCQQSEHDRVVHGVADLAKRDRREQRGDRVGLELGAGHQIATGRRGMKVVSGRIGVADDYDLAAQEAFGNTASQHSREREGGKCAAWTAEVDPRGAI